MAKLRRDHYRLLGNGYCTRPPELDCAFESVCETCAFFQTSIQFRPTCKPNMTTPTPKGRPTGRRCSPHYWAKSTRHDHHQSPTAANPTR